MGDFIKMLDYFIMEEVCFGIKYVWGKFFVFCYDGKFLVLKVIFLDGREFVVIGVDDDGFLLFLWLIYVMLNNVGIVIFVLDECWGCIMCFMEIFEYCYIYFIVDFSYVVGIMLDWEGNFYVCRNYVKSV